ncbi:MAG TPA: hypothetical protein VNL71_11375, partial [Chloroflexota bacterium]|nr:hypothetical protein [Chloroflexota bacterium]
MNDISIGPGRLGAVGAQGGVWQDLGPGAVVRGYRDRPTPAGAVPDRVRPRAGSQAWRAARRVGEGQAALLAAGAEGAESFADVEQVAQALFEVRH